MGVEINQLNEDRIETNKQIAFQISKLQIDITKLIIKNNKNETTAITLERATLSKLKTMKMKKRQKKEI